MGNNIFDFGKSELTHDAIISWIINGYKQGNSSKEFFNFSRKFISFLHSDLNLDEYTLDRIINQFNINICYERLQEVNIGVEFSNYINIENKMRNKRGKIDILVKFKHNTVPDKFHYFVIEDKVFSGESGNQFEDYILGVKNKLKIDNEVTFVNIILGNYSNYYLERVIQKKWNLVDRKMIIDFIDRENSFKSRESELLNYYKEYLDGIEKKYCSYSILNNLSEWTNFSIFGYYKQLVTFHENSDFGFVPNPNGGFCALWFKKNGINISEKINFNIYLQLEFYGKTSEEEKNTLDNWNISIKLEDKNLESIYIFNLVKISEFKNKLINLFDNRFEKTNYHKGRTITLCRKFIETSSYSDLDNEINGVLREFNYKLNIVKELFINEIF